MLRKFVFVLWVAALMLGLFHLEQYERTPGKAANASAVWLKSSRLSLASDRFTLIVFAHPHCPCTRASLTVLAEVLRRTPSPARVFVVFTKPKGTPIHWERTPLYRLACQLPAVTVLSDSDEREAKRFGARTSGQVFLYDQSGRLRFSGGITAGRGMGGDSPAQQQLLSALQGKPADRRTLPVFGCAL